MNRDWNTGLPLAFRPVVMPSDGYSMVQLKRALKKRKRINPNRKRVGKGGCEKPGGRVAVMQALRYHFGKSCQEIVELMNMPGKHAGRIVSRITLGGKPECGYDWWQRRYKQEAIDAATKLLECHCTKTQDCTCGCIHCRRGAHKK